MKIFFLSILSPFQGVQRRMVLEVIFISIIFCLVLAVFDIVVHDVEAIFFLL